MASTDTAKAQTMTQSSATKELLYNQLREVFIQRGYDGATLTHLAAASGLSKASLYHHFPGGKPEMAMVLLRYAISDLQQQAFRHLATNQSPSERLVGFVEGFSGYTDGGERDCLLAVLSHHLTAHEETAVHRAAIADQFKDWHAQVAAVYESAGMKPKRSAREAHDLLGSLYGALLNAKMHNQPKLFRAAVSRMVKALTAG